MRRVLAWLCLVCLALLVENGVAQQTPNPPDSKTPPSSPASPSPPAFHWSGFPQPGQHPFLPPSFHWPGFPQSGQHPFLPPLFHWPGFQIPGQNPPSPPASKTPSSPQPPAFTWPGFPSPGQKNPFLPPTDDKSVKKCQDGVSKALQCVAQYVHGILDPHFGFSKDCCDTITSLEEGCAPQAFANGLTYLFSPAVKQHCKN